MKNYINNLNEIETLINQIAEFDYESMGIIICMLIDTAAAKHHIPAEEIAKAVHLCVKEVNEEHGAYRIEA